MMTLLRVPENAHVGVLQPLPRWRLADDVEGIGCEIMPRMDSCEPGSVVMMSNSIFGENVDARVVPTWPGWKVTGDVDDIE